MTVAGLKGEERRKSKRVEIPFEISYAFKGKTVTQRTDNASTHGLFVSTRDQLPVGSTVRFTVSHPEFPRPLEIVGIVVHTRVDNGDPRRTGMGVQIRKIAPGFDDVFDAYCALIEKELYKPASKK